MSELFEPERVNAVDSAVNSVVDSALDSALNMALGAGPLGAVAGVGELAGAGEALLQTAGGLAEAGEARGDSALQAAGAGAGAAEGLLQSAADGLLQAAGDIAGQVEQAGSDVLAASGEAAAKAGALGDSLLQAAGDIAGEAEKAAAAGLQAVGEAAGKVAAAGDGLLQSVGEAVTGGTDRDTASRRAANAGPEGQVRSVQGRARRHKDWTGIHEHLRQLRAAAQRRRAILRRLRGGVHRFPGRRRPGRRAGAHPHRAARTEDRPVRLLVPAVTPGARPALAERRRARPGSRPRR